MIQYRDDYGRIREIAIPVSVIHQGGHQLAGFLGDKGFAAPVSKKPRAFLQCLLLAVSGPSIHVAASTGWVPGVKELVFVLPGQVIGGTNKTRVVADNAALAGIKIAQRGSFKGWREGVGKKARGNSRLILAFSTALTSPLLRFAPTITPTMPHLYADSSCGKTSAAIAAGSVWGGAVGDPLGYAQSWNGTANYTLALAAAHNDTFVIFDELRTASAPDVVKAAYTLAGGQGRGRLSKDAQRRDTGRFRTMSLSTGELNFDELERQAAGPKRQAFAGAEMRLPSIPADTGQHGIFEDIGDFTGKKNGAARFADTLQSAARDHYGHAGPRFVEEIIAEVDETSEDEFRTEIAAMVSKFVASVELADGSDNAVQRLLRTFGLIAVAGQLACRWDVLPLKEDEIRWGVATCFKAWIGARGGSRSKTSNTCLDRAA